MPREIRRVLRGLRWRIRAYVWLQGLSLALIWLVFTFWVSLAIDYLPVLAGASEMPRAARGVLLAIIAGVLAFILFQWTLRRTFVRLADRSLAVLLERRFGEFQDSLITSVELTPAAASEAHRRMLLATETQALHGLQDVRVGRVFNVRPLLLHLFSAVALAATIGCFFVVNASALELGVNRIFLLGNDPWPRNSRIAVVGVETKQPDLAGELSDLVARTSTFVKSRVKVARGASLSLLVRADGSAKVIPEICTVSYRTAEGDRGRVNMTRVGSLRDGYQLYRYGGKPFAGILSDVHFDVIGFDHRLHGYVVEAVDSPAVVAAELDCAFPDYLVDEQLSLWLPRTLELTTGMQLPQGTAITIRAGANKRLKSVHLFNPDTEESLVLEPSGDQQQFEFRVPALKDQLSLEVTLVDSDNVVSERPHRVYVAVIEDAPPVLNISLRGIGSAVTPDVVIPIQGKITDDYLVDSSWVEVSVNDLSPRQLHFERGTGGQVSTSLDFREQRGTEGGLTLEPGSKLNLVVRAQDRYDLGDQANVGTSDHFQRDVVTPDQLLVMLEHREFALRQRFEQIIEEMSETRDGLVRIKSEGPQAAPERTKQAEPAEDDSASPEAPLQRAWSVRLLRAQRAELQGQKSAQETLGVAASFLEIREELVNNRVDSEDRKERLKGQIADPLERIVKSEFAELDLRLEELAAQLDAQIARDGKSPEENPDVVAAADRSIQQTNQILVQMDQVRQNMLALESFNDLLEIVRSLIDDQQDLISKTKKQQKAQVLELLQ